VVAEAAAAGTPSTSTGPVGTAPTTGAPPPAPATPATAAPPPGSATQAEVLRIADLADAARATVRRAEPSTLTLQLHPASLGAVQVELRLEDGALQVELRPRTAAGSEQLGGALAELRRGLERAGVAVEGIDLRHPAAEGTDARGHGHGGTQRGDADASAGDGRRGGTGTVGAAGHRTASDAPVADDRRPATRSTDPGRLALDL
jgi:flagellar hook-length control protein FliK